MYQNELDWAKLSPNEQLYKLMRYDSDPVFFCEDEYGLGVPLWESQKDIITKFYGPGINELVLAAGMGGSKTTTLCFLACIELKSLLTVDWTKKLELLPHSPLFVTLASISEKQALDAVWNTLTPLVVNCPLFRFYGVEVLSDLIRFSRKPTVFLRLVSASSDTSVGRRNKFVGIDEVGKFEQTAGPRGGWQVYHSLKGGTKTFKQDGRMAVVGSPKNPKDVLMTLLRKAQDTEHMVGLKFATWEMNPHHTKEDFAEEFEIDARAALCNYGADPQAGEDIYFSNMDIFDFNGPNFLEMLQEHLDFEHPAFDYTLAGDPAPVNLSKFGLALGHKEEEKYIVDGAIAIGSEREINPLDIQKLILQIAEKFSLRSAVFDTYHFTETLEMLRAQGTMVENHIVSKLDYDNFKRHVYQDRVTLPKSRILQEEIATLTTTGQKIVCPRKGSKDVSDAVVNLVRKLSETQTISHVPGLFNIVEVF